MFKLGRSRQDLPTGPASMMQVIFFIGNLLPRSDPLSLSFYRSRSLPSGLMSATNHRSASRSMSWTKCPLSHVSAPTKYGKRTVILTLRNSPPLQ